jgi:hypothetical protein
MKKVLTGLVLSVVLIMPIGCKTNTAPAVPTTPTQKYQLAATYMNDFSADLVQAQTIEQNLYKGGAIPASTHTSIEKGFSSAAGYGIQVDALLAAEASAKTIADKIATLTNTLTSIIAPAVGMDASTTTQLQAAISVMTQLLTKVLAMIPTN